MLYKYTGYAAQSEKLQGYYEGFEVSLPDLIQEAIPPSIYPDELPNSTNNKSEYS
jgi:hypothetical protein